MEGAQLATTELGSTGMEITRVGLGAWAIGGGGWDWGWGAPGRRGLDRRDPPRARARRQLDRHGGRSTASATPRRSSAARSPASPSGRTSSPRAGSPRGRAARRSQSLARDSIRRELEGSLARLGVDAIDLYQIHWPIPDEEIEEGWATLAELKDEGLVRHIGVSNFNVEQLRRVAGDRAGRDAAAAVLADRPRGRGRDPALRRARGDRRDRLLADGLRAAQRGDDPRADRGPARRRLAHARRPRSSEPLLAREPRPRRAPAARSPSATARRPGPSPSPGRSRNPAVDGAIVGFRRPDQVDPILAAANLELDDDDIAEIDGSA